ncbi:MAG: ABC transporter ATP-binding protein [Myxococcota bacterium]
MSRFAIEASGLAKSFRTGFWMRRTEAVSGIDLQVRPGEIFGFLGPNGAGKTTTIKMLTGLVLPTRGWARVSGISVDDPRSRMRLGFLPEGTYFHDYLSGSEFLDFHGALMGLSRSARRERIPGLLERVGLAEAADRPLRSYSKGMRQRAGLAQALIGDPEVLILDEPMSGLDPIGRKQVRDLLGELRDEGRTIFFSSHILSDAELICDRVAMLVRGRVVHEGAVDDPLQTATARFELVVEGIDETLAETLASQAIRARAQGALFALEFADEAEAEKALDRVRSAGARVRSFNPHRRSLEDLMVELAKGEGA